MIKNNRLYRFCDLIATGFYVGYVPRYQGSVSSLLTTLVVFFIPSSSFFYSCLITLFLFFLGVFVSGNVAFNIDKHDPSRIVIDEIAGMWITLLWLPKVFWLYVIAFILFRFFDISKIFFINKLEKLPAGWGIMLDDILASFFSLGTLFIIRFFVGI